jgi:hypothetical protein
MQQLHPNLPDCNGPHASATSFFHGNQVAADKGTKVREPASNHGIDAPQDGLEGRQSIICRCIHAFVRPPGATASLASGKCAEHTVSMACRYFFGGHTTGGAGMWVSLWVKSLEVRDDHGCGREQLGGLDCACGFLNVAVDNVATNGRILEVGRRAMRRAPGYGSESIIDQECV